MNRKHKQLTFIIITTLIVIGVSIVIGMSLLWRRGNFSQKVEMREEEEKKMAEEGINQRIKEEKREEKTNTGITYGEDGSIKSNSIILLTHNPSLGSNSRVPYGSLPDILYIIDAMSNTIITKVTNEISGNSTKAYQLNNNKIYFFNTLEKMVQWYDFNNKRHDLQFTKFVGSYGFEPYFLISPDGQKIVWSEGIDNGPPEGIFTARLWFAEIDGRDKKILFEKQYNYNDYPNGKWFELLKWNQDNNRFYISERKGGVGGWSSGHENLIELETRDGKQRYLFDTKIGRYKQYGPILDVSLDGSLIVYHDWQKNTSGLIIHNLVDDSKETITIESKYNSASLYNVLFSEDNQSIGFDLMILNDLNADFLQTGIIRLNTKKQNIILDHPDIDYIFEKWINNKFLLLSLYNGGDKKFFIFDINSQKFSEIIFSENKT